MPYVVVEITAMTLGAGAKEAKVFETIHDAIVYIAKRVLEIANENEIDWVTVTPGALSDSNFDDEKEEEHPLDKFIKRALRELAMHFMLPEGVNIRDVESHFCIELHYFDRECGELVHHYICLALV